MSQVGVEKDIRIIRLEEAKIYLTPEEIAAYKVSADSLDLKVGDIIPKGYKRCGGCGKYKKLYLFNRNSRSALNCTGNCKECQKKASKKSYDKLKDSAEYQNKYHEKREAKLSHSKQYYLKNKERILAQQHQYHKSAKGKKAMRKSHEKRKYMLNKNAGIPYTLDILIDRDKQGGDRPICILCGKPIMHDRDIHIEHLLPVVMGGIDDFTNVGCAHSLCNLQKTKDAREITTEQVDDLITRSEAYMDQHPELFSNFFDSKN